MSTNNKPRRDNKYKCLLCGESRLSSEFNSHMSSSHNFSIDFIRLHDRLIRMFFMLEKKGKGL